MSQFALELHPDKTRLVEFGRFAMADRRARGERRPETFDFLGFTHYCKKKRTGNFGLGRKPIAKRVTRTLKRVKEKLRERMHEDVHDTAQWLGRVVNGWLNYYAVPTSARALRGFARRLLWIWLRTLRGRSQKDRTTIAGVARLAALYWPPVRTVIDIKLSTSSMATRYTAIPDGAYSGPVDPEPIAAGTPSRRE